MGRIRNPARTAGQSSKRRETRGTRQVSREDSPVRTAADDGVTGHDSLVQNIAPVQHSTSVHRISGTGQVRIQYPTDRAACSSVPQMDSCTTDIPYRIPPHNDTSRRLVPNMTSSQDSCTTDIPYRIPHNYTGRRQDSCTTDVPYRIPPYHASGTSHVPNASESEDDDEMDTSDDDEDAARKGNTKRKRCVTGTKRNTRCARSTKRSSRKDKSRHNRDGKRRRQDESRRVCNNKAKKRARRVSKSNDSSSSSSGEEDDDPEEYSRLAQRLVPDQDFPKPFRRENGTQAARRRSRSKSRSDGELAKSRRSSSRSRSHGGKDKEKVARSHAPCGRNNKEDRYFKFRLVVSKYPLPGKSILKRRRGKYPNPKGLDSNRKKTVGFSSKVWAKYYKCDLRKSRRYDHGWKEKNKYHFNYRDVRENPAFRRKQAQIAKDAKNTRGPMSSADRNSRRRHARSRSSCSCKSCR